MLVFLFFKFAPIICFFRSITFYVSNFLIFSWFYIFFVFVVISKMVDKILLDVDDILAGGADLLTEEIDADAILKDETNTLEEENFQVNFNFKFF